MLHSCCWNMRCLSCLFPKHLLQEVRRVLEELGVDCNLLVEIQLCKSQTFREQVELRLARNEPDHQTMFLHFSVQHAKEHARALLSGRWLQGISKADNYKRDCANPWQTLSCFWVNFYFILKIYALHLGKKCICSWIIEYSLRFHPTNLPRTSCARLQKSTCRHHSWLRQSGASVRRSTKSGTS